MNQKEHLNQNIKNAINQAQTENYNFQQLLSFIPKMHTRKKNSLPSINSSQMRQPQVKTISLFINNLDNHIEQSFQKLRQKRERNTQTPKIYQNRKIQESNYHDCSTFDNVSKLMLTSEKKDKTQIDSLVEMSKFQENDIALIDNQEVTQYINIVYDMYRIPDPLARNTSKNQRDQSNFTRITGSRRTMTGTPILRKKSSASSFKDKIVKHRDIDLNPFQSNRKMSKQTEVDISLLSARSKLVGAKEKQPRIIKLKQANAIPQTKPINTQILIKQPSTQSITPFTSQTFRYCFACQASVLEANLKHHEKECKLLQEALTKNIEELVISLDNKIERLKRELRNNFVESSNDPFFTQYNNLKKSVGQWISNITPANKQTSQPNTHTGSRISQIHECWGQTFNGHFEAISKLHWFSRVRQNLKRVHNV